MAAGAFGGVAAASSGALPGDSLYGLKRGIEDFKLNYLSDGDDQRGVAYLDQASNRLSEARRLIERDRSGHLDHEQLGEIRRTLAGMTHDASEGHRLLHEAYEQDPNSLGPIQALSAFSRSHREAWGALRDRLPVQLGDVSDQVSSVFDAIDEEVAPLQSLLPSRPPRPPAPAGTALRAPRPRAAARATPAAPRNRARRTAPRSPATPAPPASPPPPATASSAATRAASWTPEVLRHGVAVREQAVDPRTGRHPAAAAPGLAAGPGHRQRGRELAPLVPRFLGCGPVGAGRAVPRAPKNDGGAPLRRGAPIVVQPKPRRTPTAAAPATCTACAGSAPSPGP